MPVQEKILMRLNDLGIEHQIVTHPPVESIRDCEWAQNELNAVVPKNLFLAPRNLKQYYLLMVMPDAAFHTAAISQQIGVSRLSFGPEEMLFETLCTYPGAISPMGLIFREAKDVTLLVDERLRNCPRLAFHPNDNEVALAMASKDFFDVFLPSTGHVPRFITVEE